MAEYIERAAVNAVIDSCRLFYKWQDKSECEAYNTINKRILKERVAAIPAADVRPVVTCKECKYYKNENKGKPWKSNRRYCVRSAAVATNPDDFCSRGEKREES